MWSDSNGIMGVGYEGQDLDSFINGLRSWGVDVVADVRLNAISRKKGFSKKALTAALAEAGIEYIHLPELGNPKDNRAGFWEPGTAAARAAHARYSHAVAGEAGVTAIDRLVDEASRRRVAVLCFEQSERCCHRSLVLEAVKGRAGTLQIA